MTIGKSLRQRIATACIVMALAFASGFVLQESELLGQPPTLPGKVSLETFVEGSTDAAFTSGNSLALPGASVISR